MDKVILIFLFSVIFCSCSKKDLIQKPICEEIESVEKKEKEQRHHSRW